MSPTARSLELLRELGYTAQVVEYWHGPSKRRRDLFGCIDIVACHPEHGILGVQATTGTNHSARVEKAKRCPIKAWLQAGGKMQIWSWRKGGARGERKTWSVRIDALRVEDLVETSKSQEMEK